MRVVMTSEPLRFWRNGVSAGSSLESLAPQKFDAYDAA